MIRTDVVVNRLANWLQDGAFKRADNDNSSFVEFMAGDTKMFLCVARRGVLDASPEKSQRDGVLRKLADELEALLDREVSILFSLTSAGNETDEVEVVMATAIVLRLTIDRLEAWKRAEADAQISTAV